MYLPLLLPAYMISHWLSLKTEYQLQWVFDLGLSDINQTLCTTLRDLEIEVKEVPNYSYHMIVSCMFLRQMDSHLAKHIQDFIRQAVIDTINFTSKDLLTSMPY